MIRAWPLILVLAPAAGAETVQPAELPPPDYAGLQYVDSKGCLFARAGSGNDVIWVPRVSREGVAVCGNPVSGQRVPVVEEVGVQPVPPASSESQAAGGYFVAVGSFRRPDRAERAEARLAELDYPMVRGRLEGGSGAMITVFAGPFPDAVAAAMALDALQGAGFAEATLVGP